MRNEIRLFVLDQIKMLHKTKDTFEIPDDFDLDEFIGSSFTVFQGGCPPELMSGSIPR
jgi:hypothetical protein